MSLYTNRGDELLGFSGTLPEVQPSSASALATPKFFGSLAREENLQGLQYRALVQRLDMEASAPEGETEILHGMGLILLHKW